MGNGVIVEREVGNVLVCLDNVVLIFEKVMCCSELMFEYCKSYFFYIFYLLVGILYVYLWNGDDVSYFLIDNDRVVD